MIKTILVPTSGSESDGAVFATARMLAAPLAAHLDFYHLRLPLWDAAARAPHLDFCVGAALPEALSTVQQDVVTLAARARAHFERFCQDHDIPMQEGPEDVGRCTASWIEEQGRPLARLMQQARHHDLVVLGRPYHTDYMPRMLVEDLLMGCGRPIVIVPEHSDRISIDTIVVGWKETPEAARALAAAMPFLERARKVILLHLSETDSDLDLLRSLDSLAQQLRWHGVAAEPHLSRRVRHGAAPLAEAARELKADLLVVGAFGHARLREIVFGGVTQSLLEDAPMPVFILH